MTRIKMLVGASAVLAGLACSEGTTNPPVEPEVLALPQLIVSDGLPAVGPTAEGASSTLSGMVVFVSLPPGTLPRMESVTIRNVTEGETSPVIPIVDGGFDPVAIAALAGDQLELAFTDASGTISLAFIAVPPRRPPKVVRTRPPRGRTDVALSVAVRVVYSEPIDRATLATGMRLLRDGIQVATGVDLIPGEPWAAELVPSSSLEPGTTYELRVTTDVRDMEGDALEEPVSVTFTTGGPPGPTSASLQVVSGDNQPGRAGSELPAPFVVQVTNGDGWGVAGIEVQWTVSSGEGVLDGLWAHCYSLEGWSVPPEFDRPIRTTTVRTDIHGLAQVSFMPTWFGPTTVTATIPVASEESAVLFTTDASDPNATLEIAPGYAEESWYWELRTRRFGVVVKDGRGDRVPYVRVDWSLGGDGSGNLGACPWWWSGRGDRASRTQDENNGFEAIAMLGPKALGRLVVTAAVPGVRGSPLTFTVDATVALMYLDGYLANEGMFRGPDGGRPDVEVPVGTRVEFPIVNPTGHIVSTSSPPGGVSFDSGILESDWRDEARDWFGFVADVAGTWTFVDLVSGATGSVTAR